MEWVIGGGMVALIGLMLVNNRAQDKKIEITRLESSQENKRNYGRLDEVKEYQELTYTRKDICCERHEQITKQLDKMDGKLDKLINNGK